MIRLIDAAYARRPWLRDLFLQQHDVATSTERFKAVTTSRRGGKTVMLGGLAADALDLCRHDEGVVYLARTRQIAKDLLWSKLKRLDQAHSKRWNFREQELRVDTPNGGFMVVRGAEGGAPGEELDKLRGLKLRRALVDEPATYAETLGALLREVVEPALGDLRGDCIVAGTPGIVCAGTWHEISTGVRAKWKRWHWTILNNPHFPDAAKYLAEVREENGWDEDNATYRREYLGEWVIDDAAQVYRYLASRNDTAMPVRYDASRWVHVIGVDFGVNDDCAWTVMASHPHERRIYAISSFKRSGLLVDEAAAVTAQLCAAYRPLILVGDTGGLGKAYAEEWNRRHAGRGDMPGMLAAEKTEKRANIELLNTELRTQRLMLVQPGCKDLADEVTVLPWYDSDRLKEHPAYANHCADSMLYAFRHCYAYLHERPAAAVLPPNQLPLDSEARIAHEEDLFSRDRSADWWDDR